MCKCKGKAFYINPTVKKDGMRHLAFCDHPPDEKYKRIYETAKRINEYEPNVQEEEVNNGK